MFIQVIQGKCTRQDELRALADTWRGELGPGAAGWLGGTYGFTDDGMFVGVVRFESREAAMANSARPEQGAWAERMMALMDGPVEFHDCDDVTVFLGGGSDEARFVQVIRGKVARRGPGSRPCSLTPRSCTRCARRSSGGTLAIEPDGTFTETVAFTDEASARKGEQLEPPADIPEAVLKAMQEVMSNAVFYDLRAPWFESAG